MATFQPPDLEGFINVHVGYVCNYNDRMMSCLCKCKRPGNSITHHLPFCSFEQ